MEAKEKLDIYFKKKGVKRKELAEELGYNYTNLNNFFHRGFVNDFLDRVITHYPDIDLNWLLKKDIVESQDNTQQGNTYTKKEIIEKLKFYTEKLEQI